MSLPDPLDEARDLVGQARLVEAIELLRRRYRDLPRLLVNELTLHTARARDLSTRQRQGTLGREEELAETQRLRLALLGFIDEIEARGPPRRSPATPSTPSSPTDREAPPEAGVIAHETPPDVVATPTTRDQVFISYSHADRKWMELLSRMIRPLVRKGAIDLWMDSRIQTGSDWHREIDAALARAAVAVLLVSDHFLASDFIHGEELPSILEAADESELTIVWVHVSPCLYEETPIARYQAAHDVARPLTALSEGELGETLKSIAWRIKDAVARGTGRTVKP